MEALFQLTPLPGCRFVGELFEGVFAFGANVARHADDKLGHQADDGVFGGVDGAGDVLI